MSTSSIMVILGERQWTMQAMHLACAVARDNEGRVIVIKMVRVNNPQLLGDAAGMANYSTKDRLALHDCEATAETYGVNFEEHVCTYADYAAGLAAAADQLDATLLLVPPPPSRFAPWNRYAQWRVRRIVGRPVYGLTSLADQPAVTLGAPATDDDSLTDSGVSPLINPVGP